MKVYDFETVHMFKKMIDYFTVEYSKASDALYKEFSEDYGIDLDFLDIDENTGSVFFTSTHDHWLNQWYFYTSKTLRVNYIDKNDKKVLKFVSLVSDLKKKFNDLKFFNEIEGVDFLIDVDKKLIKVEVNNDERSPTKTFRPKDFDKIESWIKQKAEIMENIC